MTQNTDHSTLIQNLTLSKDTETLPLYIKLNKPNDIIVTKKKQIEFESRLSFDSYFNSFFTNHWLKHTPCRRFFYSLSLQGNIQIKIWKVNHKGKKSLIVDQRPKEYKPDKPVKITFEINKDDQEARFYPELLSLDSSRGSSRASSKTQNKSLFISGSLHAEDPPQNQMPVPNRVKLGIVICTFKREAYVKNTLKELLSLDSIQPHIEIYVIDNGRTLKKSELKNSVNLHLISNPNLGGAGGFARGMVEANQNESISHILLMDDDIVLDVQVVFKTIQFLKYTNGNIAIAGSMLDLKNKTSHLEGGANYSNLGLYVIHINITLDLKLSEGLERLAKGFRFDYGAWWYFVFPRKAVSEIGLPLPFFLLVDDIEYSIRLRRNHYELLSVPGIAVWHQPYYLKTEHEVSYYSIRNSLSMNGVHFSKNLYVNILAVLAKFIEKASLYNYTAAFLMTKAIEDILKGPDFFKKINEETFHQALLAIENMNLEKIYSQKSKQINEVHFVKLSLFAHARLTFQTLANYLLPKFLLRKAPVSNNLLISKKYYGAKHPIFRSFGYREIILLMPDGSIKTREISHGAFYRLSWRLLVLLTRLFFKIPSLKKEWKEEFPYLTSHEAWQKKFTPKSEIVSL